jgi:hypothetical protein
MPQSTNTKTSATLSCAVGLFLPALLMSSPAFSADEEMGWKHEVVVYGYGTSIEGDVGIRNISVPVDVGFDDILDNLKFGAMGYYEARKDDQWSLIFDVAYLSLYSKGTPVNNNIITVNTKAELSQTVVEAMVAYKVLDHEDPDAFYRDVQVDVIGGARYNQLDLSLGVEAGPLGAGSRSKKVDWVDPIIGLRTRFKPSDNVNVSLYGDVGGFGVGSDLTWQVVARVGYQFDNNLELSAGYRVLYMDYEEGSGADYFSYDATYQGPVIGLGYKF